MKTYYIKECKDENHPFGPYIKRVVYDEDYKIIYLELTERGKAEAMNSFQNYIGGSLPHSWKELQPYEHPVRKLTEEELGELMLELI